MNAKEAKQRETTSEEFAYYLKRRIGELIDKKRAEGIPAKTIALDLGISEASLSQYRSGRITPTLETAYAICNYFDISMDYLVGLSDVSSRDHVDKELHETIGLSPAAINRLRYDYSSDGHTRIGETLSWFIESSSFDYWAQAIVDYIKTDRISEILCVQERAIKDIFAEMSKAEDKYSGDDEANCSVGEEVFAKRDLGRIDSGEKYIILERLKRILSYYRNDSIRYDMPFALDYYKLTLKNDIKSKIATIGEDVLKGADDKKLTHRQEYTEEALNGILTAEDAILRELHEMGYELNRSIESIIKASNEKTTGGK